MTRRTDILVGVLIAGFALVAAAGCSDESGSASPATNDDRVNFGSAPTTEPLPECEAAATDARADWPYSVDEAVVITAYEVSDLTYAVSGVTNRPEAVVSHAIDVAFADYESGEPDGGSDDVQVGFTSGRGTAVVAATDVDDDGCWDVAIEATYLVAPEPISADAPTSTTPPVDPLDQVPSVGSAEVITARGSFPLSVTACSVDPFGIDAVGDAGTLRVTAGSEPGILQVRWEYDDGVVIEDDEAIAMSLTAAGGTIAAEGEGPEGPESVLVDIVCDVG